MCDECVFWDVINAECNIGGSECEFTQKNENEYIKKLRESPVFFIEELLGIKLDDTKKEIVDRIFKEEKDGED